MSYPTTTLAGIVALFSGDPVLTNDFAATGGLWVGGVPEEKTDLPICALLNFHEVPEWNFESATVVEVGSFDFVIYGVGLATAEGLANDLKKAFDPGLSQPGFAALPLLGSTSNWLERQDYKVRLVEYRAADSTWVYEITMSYKTTVARNI